MEKSQDTLICLLDVLGFENIFNINGIDYIKKKYENLLSIADKQRIEVAILQKYGYAVLTHPKINSAYFSDSIFFWCEYNEYSSEVMFKCMMDLLCNSIEIELPLRGSLSVGKVNIDKDRGLYLGQPIISAA